TMIGLIRGRNAQGDLAWEHRVRALEWHARAGQAAPASLYADLLETPAFNFGYYRRLPDEQEVLRLVAEGERVAGESGDDVGLARLLTDRAVFDHDHEASAESLAIVEAAPDPAPYAEAFHRLAMAQLLAGDIAQARSLFDRCLDRMLATEARVNESEALTFRTLLTFHLGDLAGAESMADRVLEISAQRSPHTESHGLGARALLQFGRGDWPGLSRTAAQITGLVGRHP